MDRNKLSAEIHQIIYLLDDVCLRVENIRRDLGKYCNVCKQALGDNYVDDVCPKCINNPKEA